MRTYAIVGLLSLGIYHRVGCLAGGPTARTPSSAQRHRPGDQQQRPVQPDPRDRQRRHYGPDAHPEPDARVAWSSSFAEQRRFLDDAGHELRTPLTVLERSSGACSTPAIPQEVAETQALLLDELDRMSRLVEDMTLLAKSNRPDFLNLAPVDLDQLTRAALFKGHGPGRAHVAPGSGRPKSTARLDPQRSPRPSCSWPTMR